MAASATSLKLHLQKHYLLKNYTSRDLVIFLDPNEGYVEVKPREDTDALRLLRATDAQVCSKYRSFLTFIRCELSMALAAGVSSDRTRLLAQRNLLAMEASGDAFVVVGTLARMKSFLSELYRAFGHERLVDEPADRSAPRSVASSPPSTPLGGHGPKRRNSVKDDKRTIRRDAPLLPCVSALLARNKGDQLIGALCNDVFKTLHGTLTDLAQCERAKDFFGMNDSIFEVYGPLTQKRVRFCCSDDKIRSLAAAGEAYLSPNKAVPIAQPVQEPAGSAETAATEPTTPGGVWSQFAKRIIKDAEKKEAQERAPAATAASPAFAASPASTASAAPGSPAMMLPPTVAPIPILFESLVAILCAPMPTACVAAVTAIRNSISPRYAAVQIPPVQCHPREPGVSLPSSPQAFAYLVRACAGNVVALRMWGRRNSVPDPNPFVSRLSLYTVALSDGEAFVVDLQHPAAEMRQAGADTLRQILGDATTTLVFYDVAAQMALLSDLGKIQANVLDVSSTWMLLCDMREKAHQEIPLGGTRILPALSLLLEYTVGLAPAQRYIARVSAASAHVAWQSVRPLSPEALVAAAAETDGLISVLRGLEQHITSSVVQMVRNASQASMVAYNPPTRPRETLSAPAADPLALAPLVDLLLPHGDEGLFSLGDAGASWGSLLN